MLVAPVAFSYVNALAHTCVLRTAILALWKLSFQVTVGFHFGLQSSTCFLNYLTINLQLEYKWQVLS